MSGDGFTATGWCQTLTHPDHLHRINDECVEPITLEERLDELRRMAREHGFMEDLTDTIQVLRQKATYNAFWGIISHYEDQYNEKEEN